MPFSWFGGQQNKPVTPLASSVAPSKLSLSSSSKDKSARLAEVRAKTKTSYLRREMAHSGELNLSRSKSGSSSGHHSRKNSEATAAALKNALDASRGKGPNPGGQNARIVAMEPDTDDSRHRRIDQGLLDASREAQGFQQKQLMDSSGPSTNKSWWPSPFSYSTSPNPASTDATTSMASTFGANKVNSGSGSREQSTISYTQTFRVP